MMKNLTKVDKALASRLGQAMDSRLRGTLRNWDSTFDPSDAKKVLQANHDVAHLVEAYDGRLADRNAASDAGLQARGYLTALREALRAIAASVAANTRYVAEARVLKGRR